MTPFKQRPTMLRPSNTMLAAVTVPILLLLIVAAAAAFVPGTNIHHGHVSTPSLGILPYLSSPLTSSTLLRDTPSGRSALPSRKRKIGKKSSRKKLYKGEKASNVLDDEELADHVSTIYLNGPGGLFYKQNGQDAAEADDDGNTTPSSSTATTRANTVQNLDRYPCLVLNADYQPLSCLPLSLWNWQDAIKAVFAEKVTVVDVYPGVHVRAAQLSIALPSVLALQEYVAPPSVMQPAFTKRNVFLRDEYRCQYCQERFATRDLSLDHVLPRCHGGSLHWENAVTSCRHCNGRKGSLMLKDLPRIGMKLSRPPRTPSPYELSAIAGKLLPRRFRLLHDTWEPYLPHSASSSSSSKDDVAMDNASVSLTTMAQQLARS